jgi:chromosome segregation ATPase
MSDFLKKFKGIFVVEDASAANESSTTTSTASTAPEQKTQQVAAAPTQTNVYATVGGRTNERFQEILLTALEKNNQEGFDYFEYRESLKNLEKMPLDEKTRFQSAFAMAQTMGATPDKLRQSAQFYVSILQAELGKFEQAHADQRARLIGDREAEYNNLEAVIKNKAEQIKQLTQEIEEATKRRSSIQAEIEQSTNKIEQTKTDFESTFQNVVSRIQSDIQKMAEYLK